MPEWRKILEAEDSDFGAIRRGQGCLEPADRGREWRVPGIRTTPPLLSLSGPSCTATSRLSPPVRSGASGLKGGLERGMEAFLSNFRSRAEPVGNGHSTRAAGVRRRKKPWAGDKSRDVFGQSASVEGFPANGRLDCCIQAKALVEELRSICRHCREYS